MKKIIVAPLNWGLGHASRCVPIIHFLLENDFVPILASDGKALTFLQKEFPNLESLELPSYNISYTKNLKLGLLFQLPKFVKTVQKEANVIADFIAKKKDVIGIISDNRFGARNAKIPSVYITHQLTVLSGIFTFFSTRIHQKIIQKFDECWVPDSKVNSLSGKLSKATKTTTTLTYIGALSRFKKADLPIKNSILIVLSGIESQRKSLEEKSLEAFKNYPKNIVLIQGKIEENQTKKVVGNLTIYNYLLSNELEREINQSEMILCRSGYSSIMDLAVLEKKAFFIPTTNQTEQEYLANYLEAKKVAPFCKEKDFKWSCLEEVKNYNGLSYSPNKLNKDLLRLF
ncbi:UDP-N-acetylglucosamine--N-acetylmuramyl-(pentapeptide) pyrophosphoryl-undecaprenol N-acetylglucosamine transferase [Polaribacter huanghezhanensis]|uniref:glycosyltransferase n=1 Tax=Polaribacter huanghezhanensis TaxID=1354726 RepID=UPI002646FF9E|nr:glycosyltransferase [Polaribacter huanghezhanensis]WKD85560.1 UDP-N-acetylglucosamine--N-acetylmuramyl-(pentapeptide) pyrophosphoryl-undecaprenol N-acetylglucosamine transferase [Polaribacter huanghezhanensis]